MNRVDYFLQKVQFWIRSKPLLYRFTLGIRALLAMGFIPTGLVKLLGYRFTILSIDNEVGAFFEMLYQTGLYWQFLGFTQVLAGILILIPAFSAVGALLFFGIMINILFITLSLDFASTHIITFQMLLATIWLIIWDFHRFRGLIFSSDSIFEKSHPDDDQPIPLPNPTLSNNYERLVYVTGTFSGLLFFGMMRGPILPTGFAFFLLAVCLICFVAAAVFGLRNLRA